jgi:hypothetical protein
MRRWQRPDGDGERWIAERKVEFRRLLRLARLLLFSVLAGDIAERKVRRGRLSVDGFRRFFRSGEGLPFLFGLQPLAIFRSQDAGAAQVLLGVDVLGKLLLVFFPRAFLSGRFGNILSVAIRYAEEKAGERQDGGHEEAAQQIPGICNVRPHRFRIFDVRCCHGNRLRKH